jgi:hypothetical protein
VSLPTSRNTTYTPASPIKSTDLNDIQDSIVNLYADARLIALSPIAAQFSNCAYNEPAGYVDCSSAPWSCSIPIVLPHGMQVRNVLVYRFGNGASSMSLKLRKSELSAGVVSMTTVKSITIASPAAAWVLSDLAMVPGDYVTTASTRLAYVYIDGASTTQRFMFPQILVGR